MILNFPTFNSVRERLDNYELFVMPNGIYQAHEVIASNYLYPMYAYHNGNNFVVSTSVYALINHKKEFVRNPRFQTTHFYQPTFMTIDDEVMRVRTSHRRSSRELSDPEKIIEIGADLIQSYVSEIEAKYTGWLQILLMGGKDSENIILTNRMERWIVVSGYPNDVLNEKFLQDNNVSVERFLSVGSQTDNSMLLKEIMGSDCLFDAAHFRWIPQLWDLVCEFKGKAVMWLGTSGDGMFSRNVNHRGNDYYAVHDLGVGMSQGALHQVYKNVLNIPVVSPYQSPQMLNKLFFRFDPYFVDTAGDVRMKIGERLLGRPVKYPDTNPGPDGWQRDRRRSIGLYINQLLNEGVPCKRRVLKCWKNYIIEISYEHLNRHSAKRRTFLSRVLFPLRKWLSKWILKIRIKRHDVASTEIK